MRFFQQLLEQVGKIYQGMSRPQRLGLLALALGSLLGIGGFVFYALRPDYQVLYSGLGPEDAGAVTAKLQSQGVPFRLSGGGSTVLVPAEHVQQLRLDLAVEGLPSKGKGFELFDEMNIGTTPFQQHVNFSRALQAELARTIMQVEPVVFARVHLVQPEQTPFVREQKPATASVILKLKPGAVLPRTTAAGIVALVARSVEGLTPENVTLLDTSGRNLSDQKGNDPILAPASSQMDYRRDLEAYLSSRAEEMLAQVLGPGRAVVRVTAEVHHQRQKTKKESYDPEQRVLVKETITNRKSSAGHTPPRGVAGAASNLPSASKQTAATGTAGSNENEENTDSEWRATRIEQEMEEGHSDIDRLTIACLVDLTRPEGQEHGLSVSEAEEIVKQAVGFKKGRDEIKVNDVKLASGLSLEGVETEFQEGQRRQWYVSLARNASLGGGALVVLVLGLLYYRRLRPAQPPAAPPAVQPTAQDQVVRMTEQDLDRVAQALLSWIEQEPHQSAPPANVRAAA